MTFLLKYLSVLLGELLHDRLLRGRALPHVPHLVVMLVMMVVMLVMMVVNIKKILLSPVLGIGRQIVDTKLSLILPLLAPIIGLKRTGLGFLRGLIDQKIALLDNISSSVGGGGGAGYGAPPQSYGAPRGWRQRRNFLRR